MIYLDYTANTPVDPEVVRRFTETEIAYIGNPNANHAAGREAAKALEEVTASIADMLGVLPEEIIFTSGASESNNLAIKGSARALRHQGKHIITTALEHASVGGPFTYLQEQGYEIDLVDITREGRIDTEHLQELLRKDTVLVSVSAVDSELGTLQPIEEIAEIVKKFSGCRLHVDATQAMGKVPFSCSVADTVSFAAHKFYGLNGSGILVKKKGLVLTPLIHGGVSNSLYRSGTPTLALASAMEEALRIALSKEGARLARVQDLSQQLREGLASYKKVTINSPQNAIPHIINLSVGGVKGQAFQRALDEKGVCVSVKSACSVENTPSKAVYAVSRNRKQALSSWRISLSHLTTEEELAQFMDIFDEIYKELT